MKILVGSVTICRLCIPLGTRRLGVSQRQLMEELFADIRGQRIDRVSSRNLLLNGLRSRLSSCEAGIFLWHIGVLQVFRPVARTCSAENVTNQ